ncbi:hypothetical protein FNV43_RR13504 [Rhamnella rubrinervis]|uniref:Zinc knuckle CX2CX4HX4C domain-containing protein n=1 Tax=Rhamnella rubrinervis TaxID=2594499 RepID=A0A8K0H191_9ROSA|nr:hypothetical protein FNV43_RR13504 [Rhamnella rubrinervis]
MLANAITTEAEQLLWSGPLDEANELSLGLQDALRNLNLNPKGETTASITGVTLLGKFVTTRNFRRFPLKQLVSKVWGLKEKVFIEKVGDNVFKFTFDNKRDKEHIFNLRSWSFDGAHLILREWSEYMGIQEVDFTFTTFYFQVHGLPPIFLHQDTTFQIGDRVGRVHDNELNPRCVVANRFLRFRVDFSVKRPIPVGYFMDREVGEDLWIQFKYERLSDFCYKCGFIDHVTGRCDRSEPIMLSNKVDWRGKLYGPWLKAENSGTVLFIETPTVENSGLQLEGRQLTGRNLKRLHRESYVGNGIEPQIGKKKMSEFNHKVREKPVMGEGSRRDGLARLSPDMGKTTFKSDFLNISQGVGLDFDNLVWASLLSQRTTMEEFRSRETAVTRLSITNEAEDREGEVAVFSHSEVDTNDERNSSRRDLAEEENEMGTPMVFQALRQDSEGQQSSRRYYTRASNKNWTWKKATRAKSGNTEEGQLTKGECSKGNDRTREARERDFL